MAQIVSSDDMTVIVLDNDEVEALTKVLVENPFNGKLDELVNGLAGLKPKRPILKLVPTEEGE